MFKSFNYYISTSFFLSWPLILNCATIFIGNILKANYYSQNFKSFTFNSSYSIFFPIYSNSNWKLCFWASITLLCICLMSCNLCNTSYMIIFFHFFIFFFFPWSSCVPNYVIKTFTDFITIVVQRRFNRFIAFLLIALKIPKFSTQFFSMLFFSPISFVYLSSKSDTLIYLKLLLFQIHWINWICYIY